MRGVRPLVAILLFALIPVPGCRTSDRPAPAADFPSVLQELGRPWPVKIGRFPDPFRFLAHGEAKLLFAAGRPAVRYQLDYPRRRLVRLPAADPQKPDGDRGETGIRLEHAGDTLSLLQPDGSLLLTDSLLGEVWAQTKDRRAIAFYEKAPEGPRLVYCDVHTGARAIWRRLEAPPAAAALTWSGEGKYLAEERDGVLTVFVRTDGSTRWSAGGAAPRFGPGERFLLFRRGDGGLSLLDLVSGYARTLPAPNGSRVVSSAWSQDGERVFYVCESGTESGKGAAHFLCLYAVRSGTWQRHPFPEGIDPLASPALLRARPTEVGRLAALLPRLNEGTLSFLEEGRYLAGFGRELVLLDLSQKNAAPKPLYRFPGLMRSLSLAGRRLAVVVEEREGPVLYSWHLPASGALTGIFPDRRDLTLGRLALGMDTVELRSALGAPLEAEKRPDPFGGQRILVTYYYPEVAVTVARGRVERIIYSGPGVETPRGVAIGASRDEVLARYGRPDYDLRDYLAYRGEVDGIVLKVAFNFEGEGRVAAILLEREEGRIPTAKAMKTGRG